MEKRYAVTYRRACNGAVEQIFCDTAGGARRIASTLNTMEIDPYRLTVTSMLRKRSVAHYSHLNPSESSEGR